METPVPSRPRRALLRGAAAAGLAALVGCAEPQPAPASSARQRLRLLGEASLPHRLPFKGTAVGGLSAIDFDAASGHWLALSDDRSELQPARFYTLQVDVRAGGLAVGLLDVVTLRDGADEPYPARRSGGEVVDPEALRLLPGGRTLLWASEGDPRVNQPPALHEARADGRWLRSFALPELLRDVQHPGRGPRDNGSLEGLALTPDGRTAWAAMEAPLQQDGPEPRVGRAGAPCRFTAFDVATGRAVRQIAYPPDAIPIAPRVPGTYADNGVSEILMIDAHRMLVLERAYALGTGTSLRLYEIDTRAADDTLALGKLEPGRVRVAHKQPVADFARLGLARTDNTEGMCWGPPLAGGRRTLVVVSDDNFNPRQVTQFAAFEYLE